MFPKHKCIYLHMRPSARAPDLSPDKTHCGLQQMDTDTHTRTKKNNEIPPELSHTATTLGELEKNSSLSFSVVPHSVSNLSHLSDNLSLSHYSLIFPPQLAAGCDAYMCVSVCVCLVETALLDKGPQGSFVKIVKHCVGLVAGDRAGVREKQGNAFRYN